MDMRITRFMQALKSVAGGDVTAEVRAVRVKEEFGEGYDEVWQLALSLSLVEWGAESGTIALTPWGAKVLAREAAV